MAGWALRETPFLPPTASLTTKPRPKARRAADWQCNRGASIVLRVMDAEVQALAHGFRLRDVECAGEMLFWWERRAAESSPIFVTRRGAYVWMSACLQVAESSRKRHLHDGKSDR